MGPAFSPKPIEVALGLWKCMLVREYPAFAKSLKTEGGKERAALKARSGRNGKNLPVRIKGRFRIEFENSILPPSRKEGGSALNAPLVSAFFRANLALN